MSFFPNTSSSEFKFNLTIYWGTPRHLDAYLTTLCLDHVDLIFASFITLEFIQIGHYWLYPISRSILLSQSGIRIWFWPLKQSKIDVKAFWTFKRLNTHLLVSNYTPITTEKWPQILIYWYDKNFDILWLRIDIGGQNGK